MSAVLAMTLADYTSEELCLAGVPACDPPTVLSALSHALEAARVVNSSLSLFNDALNRYFLAHGDHLGAAAYTIGSLPSVSRTAFAVARTSDQCWWRQGAMPVDFVFLIATQPANAAMCLEVVAGFKRLAAEPPILALLQSADQPALMHAALSRVRLGDLSPAAAIPASKIR